MDGADSSLQPIQGGGQDGAGTNIGQGRVQLVDKISLSKDDNTFDGGHRPLPGSDSQGEELDDVGQLRLDP